MCDIVPYHTNLNKNITTHDQFFLLSPVDSISDSALCVQIQLIDQPEYFLNQNIAQTRKSAGKGLETFEFFRFIQLLYTYGAAFVK